MTEWLLDEPCETYKSQLCCVVIDFSNFRKLYFMWTGERLTLLTHFPPCTRNWFEIKQQQRIGKHLNDIRRCCRVVSPSMPRHLLLPRWNLILFSLRLFHSAQLYSYIFLFIKATKVVYWPDFYCWKNNFSFLRDITKEMIVYRAAVVCRKDKRWS